MDLKSSSNPVQNEIYEAAYTYVLIIFIGTITQIFYNLICSFLRSVGDSLTPLLFLIFSTILNILLDILFIAVFKWGVKGAGIATVIAQAISAIGCFGYTFIHYKEYRLSKEDFKLDGSFIFKTFKIRIAISFSIFHFMYWSYRNASNYR